MAHKSKSTGTLRLISPQAKISPLPPGCQGTANHQLPGKKVRYFAVTDRGSPGSCCLLVTSCRCESEAKPVSFAFRGLRTPQTVAFCSPIQGVELCPPGRHRHGMLDFLPVHALGRRVYCAFQGLWEEGFALVGKTRPDWQMDHLRITMCPYMSDRFSSP